MIFARWVKNGKLYCFWMDADTLAILILITGLSIELIIRLIKAEVEKRDQRRRRKLKLPPPKPGGADNLLEKCIDTKRTYELVDNKLKIIFFQNFKNVLSTNSSKAIIINLSTFVYLFIISNNKLVQFTLKGLQLSIYDLKKVIFKGGGALTITLILAKILNSKYLISLLVTSLTAFGISYSNPKRLKCGHLVRELPEMRIERTRDNGPKHIPYLDEVQESANGRIFIMEHNTKSQNQIYVLENPQLEACEQTLVEQWDEINSVNPMLPWVKERKKTTVIERKCDSKKKKYIPLESRTSTLSDLIDTSNNSDKQKATESCTQHYERQNKQEKIRNNKIDN